MSARFGPAGQPKTPVAVYLGLATLIVLPFSVIGSIVTAAAGLAAVAAVSMTPQFRSHIDSKEALESATAKRAALLAGLDSSARQHYLRIESRCAAMASDAGEGAQAALRTDALQQLCWLHLHLMAGRGRVLSATTDVDLSGQPHLKEAADARLAEFDEQIARIERQLDRLQVEGVLRDDPGGLASRIDAVVWTLDDTGAWLRDHDIIADASAPLVLEGATGADGQRS